MCILQFLDPPIHGLIFSRNIAQKIKNKLILYKMKSKTRKLLIVGFIALIILAIGGMYSFVGVGTALSIALAIFVLLGVVPFLIGVIIQRMFCFIQLPSYVSWIISIVAVSLFWLTQGKILISVLENSLLSFLVSILLYGIFIDAGVNVYNAFREGSKKT